MKNIPIPEIKMPNKDNLVYEKIDEVFVDIYLYSNRQIHVEMKYFKQNIKGSINVAYCRKTVADMLIKAKSYLPKGYSFKIYDAWRPYEVQKALYDDYFNKLKKNNKDLSIDDLHNLSKQFVSFPSKDEQFSFVHSSGGAIDLTIVDENGNELDMGCEFDDFSSLANTTYFENIDGKVKENRRMLYHSMIKAGFTNFKNEWWHYDYNDIFYASLTNKLVRYDSIYSIEEVKERLK